MTWIFFLIFLAACFGAGATGAIFPPGAWYRALSKPTWTPPDWVFPVVWTTLYACIAYAATRVAMAPSVEASLALALWAVQMTLNGLWTPVFFGLRRIRAGMLVLSLLWLAVAATLVALWRVDLVAGLLFVPYLVWVSIAGALNLSVWRLNPDVARKAPVAET